MDKFELNWHILVTVCNASNERKPGDTTEWFKESAELIGKHLDILDANTCSAIIEAVEITNNAFLNEFLLVLARFAAHMDKYQRSISLRDSMRLEMLRDGLLDIAHAKIELGE